MANNSISVAAGTVFPDAPRAYETQSNFIDGLACNCGGVAIVAPNRKVKTATFNVDADPYTLVGINATINGRSYLIPVNVAIYAKAGDITVLQASAAAVSQALLSSSNPLGLGKIALLPQNYFSVKANTDVEMEIKFNFEDVKFVPINVVIAGAPLIPFA